VVLAKCRMMKPVGPSEYGPVTGGPPRGLAFSIPAGLAVVIQYDESNGKTRKGEVQWELVAHWVKCLRVDRSTVTSSSEEA